MWCIIWYTFAAATQPDLYGDHTGEEVGRAGRAKEGAGHRRAERPPAAAVFGAAGESGTQSRTRNVADFNTVELLGHQTFLK